MLRYPKPHQVDRDTVDGLRNFFSVTAVAHHPALLLDHGVDFPAAVTGPDGPRRPVILIRSTPRKAGTRETPWQDYFDPDHGHIRYFGDAKVGAASAESSRGNRLLLSEANHWLSDAPDGRAAAVPLLFFRAQAHAGRAKGQVAFQGFGVLERAERVAQVDPYSGLAYGNYRYDFALLALDDESMGFDWSWIARRRDPSLTAPEADRGAPLAWQRWKKTGIAGLGVLRRRVAMIREINKRDQSPAVPSQRRILKAVYSHYGLPARRHFFEGLAEAVTDHVLRREGLRYYPGWITRRSGDEGIDFVGRFDVGQGLARVSVVVLGQAKVVAPTAPISGLDVSRVVARLRRGWIGVFVTTGYFSRNVQREIIDDEYPVVLIGAGALARAIEEMLHERGLRDPAELFERLEHIYLDRLVNRRPQEILLD